MVDLSNGVLLNNKQELSTDRAQHINIEIIMLNERHHLQKTPFSVHSFMCLTDLA